MKQMEPWTDMRSPALAIVARGDQIETVRPTQYVVRSQSRPDAAYTVESVRDRWTCTCAFHAETGRFCIHILAVRYRNGLIEPTAKPETETVCERCRSADVVANGKRHNKSGTLTRYLCKTCGFRFTGRDGFQRRRSEPEKIALALDLYFRGMSLRQVADHLRQVYNLKLSPMTVYRWITRYSRLAAEWMNAQGAKVGDRWHVDETVVNVDGEGRYLWNVLDAETRFLLATHVSRVRGLGDTRAPLRKAKAHTKDRPAEVFTDGMMAYPLAVSKEFGKLGGPKGYTTPHRRVPSIRAAESNNLVERLHGSEKDRTKVMRAFDTEAGTAALMEGYRVHYNLVRPHIGLGGATPGEAAGIPGIDGFRWLELLKLSVTRNGTSAPEVTESPD